MVDPAGDERHLVERHVNDLSQLLGGGLGRHAQADHAFHRSAGVDRPAQGGHRVRVVVEPRVRAELGHVARE